MLTFLSQKLKFILIFVLAIIGISFVFFGNWSGQGGGPTLSAKIAGRPISLADFQNSLRATRVAYTLGTGQIPGTGDEFTQALSRQAWKRLMLLAEIHANGLTVDPQHLQDAVRKHPLFQDPQKQTFSPENFKRFQDFVLTPQGITLDRFLEIMRDQILIDTWLTSLQDAAVVQPSEAEEAVRKLYAPVSMEYVVIDPKTAVGTIPADDNLLRAFYEKRVDRFSLPEQRKVDYVIFALPPKLETQPAESQAKVRRDLGEKAYQFTEPFYTALENNTALPDFATQAQASGLEVKTSPYFARNGSVLPGPGPSGGALAQLAFTLTKERPVSDYIQLAEGYAVVFLREIQPPAVRPFETVEEDVRKLFIESEAQVRLQNAAENVALQVRKELSAGKSFAQAAAGSNLKSIPVPPFLPSDTGDKKANDPMAGTARMLSMQLRPGQISQPTPRDGKILLYYLSNRGEIDPAKKTQMIPLAKEQLLQQRRGQLRDEYLTSLGRRKGTTLPAQLFSEELN